MGAPGAQIILLRRLSWAIGAKIVTEVNFGATGAPIILLRHLLGAIGAQIMFLGRLFRPTGEPQEKIGNGFGC